MVLLCSKCGHRFESLIVDRDLAVKELFKSLTDHGKAKHRENMQMLAKGCVMVTAAMSFVLTIDEMAVIPEDETYLQETRTKFVDTIMSGMGYDPEEEEVWEDEDEDVEGEETETEDDGDDDSDEIEEVDKLKPAAGSETSL